MRLIRLFLAFAFFSALVGCCDDPPVPPLQPPTANAGPSQIINSFSTTLTGTSSSSNGPITNVSWTLVSGPNVPALVSPGAETTSVTGLALGSYIFQYSVTDPAGLSASDTMTVTVLQGGSNSVTLQPSNSNSELAMVLWSTIYSDPAASEILAEAWTSGGDVHNVRSLFKFDLSSIPAGATIISARLTLYSNPSPVNGNLTDANFGPANAFYLSRVISTWNSGTLWTDQPALDMTSRLFVPHTDNAMEDLLDVDVLSLVTPMASGNNYGFQVQLENEEMYNSRIYCSSHHADASKHPKLVITYQ